MNLHELPLVHAPFWKSRHTSFDWEPERGDCGAGAAVPRLPDDPVLLEPLALLPRCPEPWDLLEDDLPLLGWTPDEEAALFLEAEPFRVPPGDRLGDFRVLGDVECR